MELPLERETEGFEKIPSLMGKSDANECNESSLSNCRVQLALSTKKDGMILENLIMSLIPCNYNSNKKENVKAA